MMNLCFRPTIQALVTFLLIFPLAALWGVSSGTPARAHEIRPAIVDLFIGDDGGVRLEMSLILEAALAEVGAEHADTDESPNAGRYDALRLLDEAALAAEFERSSARFLDGVRLMAGDQRIPLDVDSLDLDPVGDTDFARLSRIALTGQLPAGATDLTYSFDPAFGPSVIRVPDEQGANSYSAYLDNGSRSAPIPVEGALTMSAGQVFVDYIGIGFTHIVPKGLDHILFVVGLFLLSPRLKPLLVQVTAFTVAHSVTLALAMLGVLTLPGSIVEPLIAASILFIAVENLGTDRLTRWRPYLVFAFGLLHGLGFAGVLNEIGLSPAHFASGLVGFNIGVEAGQLAVVAGCFALFGAWFADRPWYRTRITIPLSLAIAAIAAWWVLERTGLVA